MIRLQRSMLEGLTGPAITPQSVCASLQSAVELEHATIPVYLYGLYSLDAAKNAAIANIIQSVVVEEMLHMTLASNVLNALGGSPVIDSPGFIPTFPGPLPGGVESDLTVNLAPFSMNQLQTYLQIEKPEDPLDIKLLASQSGTITIGQFYTAISDAIAVLGDSAFVDPPRNQVGPDLMRESVVVVDVATAQQALGIIIEQGEGSTTSPEDGYGEPAHYYRFMQIEKGALLVPAPGNTPPWAYGGAAVTFDPTGVYAVPTNPALPPGYAPGTVQAFANDNFNYTYTNLLQSLHALFNGDVGQDQMNRAIGLMMSLKGQAKAMMAGIPDPSVMTGPSFEYQPVNPAG
jgi:Ferritin-like